MPQSTSPERIIELRDAGRTFREIGEEVGISAASARLRYLRATGQLARYGEPRTYSRDGARRARRSIFAGGSTRTFGVEVEHAGLGVASARQALRDGGITVADTRDYTHEVVANWKVVSDASVYNGAEAVSPPMGSDEGAESLRSAMRALKAAGGSVNNSCGMHVHVSMDGLNGAEIAQLIEDFRDVQGIVDSFVPSSRRSGRGTYSGSRITPSDRFLSELRTNNRLDRRSWHGRSNQDVRSVAHRQWGHGRYSTLNFDAFAAYGTVEFRQHGGTLNPKKALAWVEMLVTFVEASQRGVLVKSSVQGFLDSLKTVGLSDANARYLLRRAEQLGVPAGTLLAEPEPTADALTAEVSDLVAEAVAAPPRPAGYAASCECTACRMYTREVAQAR